VAHVDPLKPVPEQLQELAVLLQTPPLRQGFEVQKEGRAGVIVYKVCAILASSAGIGGAVDN